MIMRYFYSNKLFTVAYLRVCNVTVTGKLDRTLTKTRRPYVICIMFWSNRCDWF